MTRADPRAALARARDPGQRSGGGNQRRHYELAHGSANEVKGALAVAEAWGWIGEADRVRAILDRLLALLWRLTHPRKAG